MGRCCDLYRHSENVEKQIEAKAEILFFTLCGIAESWNATTMRSRVRARNDVKAEVLMNSLFPLSRWERVSEGQERDECVIASGSETIQPFGT